MHQDGLVGFTYVKSHQFKEEILKTRQMMGVQTGV